MYLPGRVRRSRLARWLAVLVLLALPLRPPTGATSYAEAHLRLQQSTTSLSTQEQSASSGTSEERLLAESARLLELSRQLQVEVGRSSKDTLSLPVVRKAEEVERLAKSLKERLGKAR